MTARPLDHEDRERARCELGRNIVVSAGAGTGKTTLLTDRILFLILAGGPGRSGIKITEIVALTFTDKAAGEIRERVTGKLIDLLAALDGTLADAKRRRWADEFLETLAGRFGRDPRAARPLIESALEAMSTMMRNANVGSCSRVRSWPTATDWHNALAGSSTPPWKIRNMGSPLATKSPTWGTISMRQSALWARDTSP